MLTLGTFNLAMWLFWALLTVFGFAASLKRTAERMTERYCARRRLRRARAGMLRAQDGHEHSPCAQGMTAVALVHHGNVA
jgi:hypothetical protein